MLNQLDRNRLPELGLVLTHMCNTLVVFDLRCGVAAEFLSLWWNEAVRRALGILALKDRKESTDVTGTLSHWYDILKLSYLVVQRLGNTRKFGLQEARSECGFNE